MSPTPEAQRRERFEALAAEVWSPLQRYLARRVGPPENEDVLAEVLLVLWRRLDAVPPGAALPWSYRVAQNCLANSRRSSDRQLNLVRRLREQAVIADVASSDPGLDEAMAALRPQDREVLKLWAWEGLEPRELAVVLDCTANAAAVRLSRAREALRVVLSKDPRTGGHKQGEEEEVPQS